MASLLSVCLSAIQIHQNSFCLSANEPNQTSFLIRQPPHHHSLLNRVDEIRNVNYIPNNDDILQSRRRTSDIQKLEFQVKLPVKSGANIQQTFCMFDVGGQRGERRKWIQVFDGVSAVMFLIDSSSFDAVDDENGRNKLRETINLFYEVWTTRFLLNSNFVLLFNKQDILKEKIERGHKIEDHFPEYKLYKFQPQDRPLHGRSGEKLNLFRSSSSRSSPNLSSRSTGSTTSSTNNSKSSTTTTASAPVPNQASSSHDKRKTISLCHFRGTGASKSVDHADSRSLGPPSTAPVMSSNVNPFAGATSNLGNNNINETNLDDPYESPSSSTSSNAKTTITTNTNKTTSNITAQKEQQDQASANHLAYLKARSFIRDKFLQITRQVDNDQRKFSSPNLPMYNSKGSRVDHPKRNVCYHYTTATDTENIRDLFENLQKMVIKSTMKDLA